MDPPKTRKESKKDQKQKGQGKDGKYSQKHIRAVEELKRSKGKSNVRISETPNTSGVFDSSYC
jgi:hypothetical protein